MTITMHDHEPDWQELVEKSREAPDDSLDVDLRCEALELATTLHAASLTAGREETPDDVLDTARMYLAFLKGG